MKFYNRRTGGIAWLAIFFFFCYPILIGLALYYTWHFIVYVVSVDDFIRFGKYK